MDLNRLLAQHQLALMRAAVAACVPSRDALLVQARGYVDRIRALQLASGATARQMPA